MSTGFEFSYLVRVWHHSEIKEIIRVEAVDSINDLRIAKEDSYSGMRTRKLVTEVMVKPVDYDVHSVHTAVIINTARSEYLINW